MLWGMAITCAPNGSSNFVRYPYVYGDALCPINAASYHHITGPVT